MSNNDGDDWISFEDPPEAAPRPSHALRHGADGLLRDAGLRTVVQNQVFAAHYPLQRAYDCQGTLYRITGFTLQESAMLMDGDRLHLFAWAYPIGHAKSIDVDPETWLQVPYQNRVRRHEQLPDAKLVHVTTKYEQGDKFSLFDEEVTTHEALAPELDLSRVVRHGEPMDVSLDATSGTILVVFSMMREREDSGPIAAAATDTGAMLHRRLFLCGLGDPVMGCYDVHRAHRGDSRDLVLLRGTPTATSSGGGYAEHATVTDTASDGPVPVRASEMEPRGPAPRRRRRGDRVHHPPARGRPADDVGPLYSTSLRLSEVAWLTAGRSRLARCVCVLQQPVLPESFGSDACEEHRANGQCDDGGVNSTTSLCAVGTDGGDCGVRHRDEMVCEVSAPTPRTAGATTTPSSVSRTTFGSTRSAAPRCRPTRPSAPTRARPGCSPSASLARTAACGAAAAAPAPPPRAPPMAHPRARPASGTTMASATTARRARPPRSAAPAATAPTAVRAISPRARTRASRSATASARTAARVRGGRHVHAGVRAATAAPARTTRSSTRRHRPRGSPSRRRVRRGWRLRAHARLRGRYPGPSTCTITQVQNKTIAVTSLRDGAFGYADGRRCGPLGRGRKGGARRARRGARRSALECRRAREHEGLGDPFAMSPHRHRPP